MGAHRIGPVGLLGLPVASAHEPGEHEEAEEAPPIRTAPVLVERAEPTYPAAARAEGLGGTVSLELSVGLDGTVSDAKVVRSAGHGFDEAALEAARHFKWRPATDHGKAVASTVLFDQRFSIRPHLVAETTADPAPTEASEPGAEATRPHPEEARHDPAGDHVDHGTAPPPEPGGDGRPHYQSTISDVAPKTAASASSIRNQDFDLRPKTSPNDVLRVVPGLLAVQHQGGGKADQLFLRGFDADHGTDVAVFVDGVPVNLPSHAHGQGYTDLHWLIPETLERIDVMKGPYDARDGDFATAGAIHLITRKDIAESSAQFTLGGYPTQGCQHVDANFTGGSTNCPAIGTQRFVGIIAPRLSGSGWAAKLHPWLAFEAAHDDGPFVAPEHLRRYNLFGKLSYDLSPSTTIGLFFSAYGSEWTGSGQIPARLVGAGQLSPFGALDPSEGGLTERQMATAFIHHKAADAEWNATLYVTRYRLSLWNDFTFFSEDPVHGSSVEQDDSRVYTGLRADYHFHRHVRGIRFRTTFGAEARYDGIHVDRWDSESCGVNGTPASECPGGDFRKRLGRHTDAYGSGLPFSANNDDVDQSSIAAFVEEDVIFNRYFRLIAALRADYFSWNVNDKNEAAAGSATANTSGVAQKALLSPKLSAVITPVPGHLDLYVNYGNGFHTNPAQIALLDGLSRRDPQGAAFTVRAVPKIYGGEVGARVHLFHRLDVAAAFWVSYLESETVFDADHGSFLPSDATLRIGLDAEVRLQILPWLYLDYDLAQADPQSRPDGAPGGGIALAPRLYMTGGLSVNHPLGIRAGLRMRYLGDRPAFDERSAEYLYFTSKTIHGAPNPDYDPARVTAQGYVIFDAYVGYRRRWFEASLSIQNLFNQSWREAQFGNHSCTRDETYSPANPNYAGSGGQLGDGSYANRCGIGYGTTRSGVTDVHFTPGVPFNPQLTVKAYF